MAIRRAMAMVATVLAAVLLCFGIEGCSGVAISPANNLTGLASLRGLSRDAMPYSEAISNDRPTLVEFYADWCTTCQGMAPMLQELHQQQPDLNFVAVNIDEPRWADLVARYEVSGIPKLVLLDREAKSTQTFVGSVPQVILERAIATIAD